MLKKEWGAESCCDRWIRRPWHRVKEKRQRPQIVYSIYMKFPKTTNERKWIGGFQRLGRQGMGLVSPRHTGNGKWVPQVTSPGEMMYRSQNKTETVVVQLCKSTKSSMFTWEGFILRYLNHMEMSGFFFFTPQNPSPSFNTTQEQKLARCQFCLERLIYFNFLCMSVSPAWVYAQHAFVVPQNPEEGVRCPGTGVTDSCEPPCRSWEVNPGPPQEQPGVLTTEPSLRPQGPGFKGVSCCSLELAESANRENTQGRGLGRGEISLGPKCKAQSSSMWISAA